MNVGIDAHALGSRLGGNETYIRNVIRGLTRIDPAGYYTVFTTGDGAIESIPGTERMREVVVHPHTPLVRIPLSFPVALWRNRIDVVHVQYVAPPLCPARVVTSIHDLAYERYPEFFTRGEVARFKTLIPITVRQARVILTLSEFSKADIIGQYGVSDDRVVVAPCAADPMFIRIDDQNRLAAIRHRYRTGDHFILTVGNLQPRKNLRRLIDAYVAVRREGHSQHKLVIVGRRAWLYDETFAAARDSGYADDLIFTDYVPAEDLVALYNAADLFVYPSIFEGFGLPPLEAMACGTPVITGNTSALPEVVGDAGVMVDPFDTEALAGAIGELLHDDARRADLSARGHQRAGTFSWETSARIIVDAYKRAVA